MAPPEHAVCFTTMVATGATQLGPVMVRTSVAPESKGPVEP